MLAARELNVERAVAELRVATAPGEADALREAGRIVAAVDRVMDVNESTAAAEEGIDVASAIGGPIALLVEDHDVRRFEVGGRGPRIGRGNLHAPVYFEKVSPHALPRRVVMFAGAVVLGTRNEHYMQRTGFEISCGPGQHGAYFVHRARRGRRRFSVDRHVGRLD